MDLSWDRPRGPRRRSMFRRGYSCGPPAVARLGHATLWKNSGCLFLEPVRGQRRVRAFRCVGSLRGTAAEAGVFRVALMGTTRSIAVVIAVVLSACAAEQRDPLTPRAPTLKEQSLLLKGGMSEQEVTKLLGLPSKAEVGRCGENTPTPWTCKTWTYGSAPSYALQGFFRENAGEWRLASWNVAL